MKEIPWVLMIQVGFALALALIYAFTIIEVINIERYGGFCFFFVTTMNGFSIYSTVHYIRKGYIREDAPP